MVSRKGHPEKLGLPARITAGQMCVPEQARRPVTESLVTQLTLSVGPLTYREVAALALVALSALDGERNDDAVTLLELALRDATHLNDLTHRLVPHDVAGQHRGNEVVKEV